MRAEGDDEVVAGACFGFGEVVLFVPEGIADHSLGFATGDGVSDSFAD